jgi:hypothetical protein
MPVDDQYIVFVKKGPNTRQQRLSLKDFVPIVVEDPFWDGYIPLGCIYFILASVLTAVIIISLWLRSPDFLATGIVILLAMVVGEIFRRKSHVEKVKE